MKKLSFLLVFIPLVSFGQEYLPKRTSQGELVKHKYITLSYNEKHEQAEWVHYRLDSIMLNGTLERKTYYTIDPKVSTVSAKFNDYTNSEFERGHLVPAADMKMDSISVREVAYMSNISPQDPSFNKGGWKKLEKRVRFWAIKDNLYIITAGILNDNLETKIGRNKVSVPNKFYKIVYNEKLCQMIAFVMPNRKIEKPIEKYVVSVNEVEELTGVDFFYEMDDEIEEKLESEIVLNKWVF